MNILESNTYNLPAVALVTSPVTFQLYGESAKPLRIDISKTPDGENNIITGALPNYPQFCLHSPITVVTNLDDDGTFVASADLMPISGYGKTAAEALGDFLESLGGTWIGIKDRPDHELTSDAIELRGLLEAYFSPHTICYNM